MADKRGDHDEDDEIPEIAGGHRGDDSDDQDAMINVVKSKLGSLAIGELFVKTLPVEVQRRVKALEKLHETHEKLEEDFRKELRELELKYFHLYQPLYQKRSDIANGVVEPTDEEAGVTLEDLRKAKEEAKVEVTDLEGEKESAEKKDEGPAAGIPDFWLTAFRNHEGLNDQITDKDAPVLKFLHDIKCSPLEESKQGFKLEFKFAENPYFSNEVLTKTYFMMEDEELILDHAEGTTIDWKPSKNVTVKMMKKKTGGKGRKPAKTVTKLEPCDSFFNFFSPPKVPDDNEELDEMEEQQLQDALEADYDMGCVFKDRLVPHAVQWYTGEALKDEYEDDDDEGDDGDDDDADEDDEEDDDEDEDEDDDEEVKPKNVKPKKGGAGARGKGPGGIPPPGVAQQPPECKQQ